MPPESARNRNLRVLKDGINQNRRRIKGLQQQQQAINDDNRKRDQNISEISHNLALLKSFVTEKLSNHPNDYVDFVNHLSSQPINNSIVSIGGPLTQGGKRKRKTRRKTRRKTKKRKTRRKKRKTRRKKRN